MGVRWELPLFIFIPDPETVLLAHPTPQKSFFSFDGNKALWLSAYVLGHGLSLPTPTPHSIFADIITASFASLITSARLQASLFKTKQTKLSHPPAPSALLLPSNGAQSKQPWHPSLHLLWSRPPKPDWPAFPGKARPYLALPLAPLSSHLHSILERSVSLLLS